MAKSSDTKPPGNCALQYTPCQRRSGYLLLLVGVLLVWDSQIQKTNRSLWSIMKYYLTTIPISPIPISRLLPSPSLSNFALTKLKPLFSNPHYGLLWFPYLVLPYSTTLHKYWIYKSIYQDKTIKSIIMLYADHKAILIQQKAELSMIAGPEKFSRLSTFLTLFQFHVGSLQ